jgi:HD-GYP domain-containing protein (c-di-GMP phosphodiesterase class II)
MTETRHQFVAIEQLRIGMYVELELGWMSHPFPKGSFKLSSDKQIDTIRGLGLKRVRHVPEKSDPEPDATALLPPAPAATEPIIMAPEPLVIDPQAHDHIALQTQNLRRQRASQIAAQQQSLVVCERRFGEAIRQYKKTVDQITSHPKQAMEQSLALVTGFVDEMLVEGESAIRLLSEGMGDRASMHPVNVTIISLLLGKATGLSEPEMVDLGLAAFLHDIGKTQLPDRVRWLQENFSPTEYKLYQEHVAESLMLGKRMALSEGAMLAIAQHHELIDGSGFPAQIKGDGMTRSAKILALVNRYENLCNPSRPAAAITPHEALSLIFAQMKTRFDGVALSAFIRMMGVYPPGSVVQLVDERYAIVVSVNSARPLKPRVIVHEPAIPKDEALILDLEHVPTVGIRRSIKPASLPKPAMDYLSPRQRICYFFERAMDPELHKLNEARP